MDQLTVLGAEHEVEASLDLDHLIVGEATAELDTAGTKSLKRLSDEV